jgi:myo-inositol-1(or 4)-monophosphatase
MAFEMIEQASRIGVGKDHDIRRHRLRVESRFRPAIGNRAGQALSPLMIRSQTIEAMAQRHQAGRGNHPGLPHGTAQAFPFQHGRRHEVRWSGQNRAHWGTQTLGEAASDGGRHGGSFSHRLAASDGGVPQASAVKVDAQAVPARHGRQGMEAVRVPDCAAGSHVGVLEGNGGDVGLVVGAGLDQSLHPACIEGALLVGKGQPCHTRIHRPGAGLVEHQMLPSPGDDPVPGPGQHPQGDLVGHGAGRDKQRRLSARQVGEGFLEQIDCWVLAILIITDLRLRHGPAHLRRRSGYGVGAEIYQHGAKLRYNWFLLASPDTSPPAHTVADVFGSPPDRERPDPLLTELAAVALECADAAAAVLRRGLGAPPQSVDTKSSSTDMVSEVDRDAEAAVSRVLASLRPDDGVLGEEGTARPAASGVRWVVDPLDGTTNFLFGIPQFAVSVAAEVDGTTKVGIVVDPSRQETWAAVAGWGARRNGSPCRVASGRSTLATALVATGFGYRPARREWQGGVAAHVLPRVRDIRRLGAAALDLCWTAGGRFDAYYEWGLNPWDLAAGALICAEAGARVRVFAGRLIVATTPELFDPFCDLLIEAGATDIPQGPEPALW